jgi:xylulokinase
MTAKYPNRRLTIGVDLGSSGVKALLVDSKEGILAEANCPTGLYTPFAGAAEADASEWIQAAQKAVRGVVTRSGIDPQDVAGVAITGMVPAVVVTDAQGQALRRPMLQNDARAETEVQELSARLATVGVDVLGRTGSAVTQQSVAPTLMWLKRHEPDVMAKAALVQGSYDWLAAQMGARPHVEHNWAIESGFFDLHTDRLIPEVLEAAGLDAALLPPMARPAQLVGALNAAWARATGLAPGTPILAGGADHVLSAYAAGVEAPGDYLVKLGGAGDILAAANQPLVDGRLYLDAHPAPGRWLVNGCMATSGSLTRWFSQLVGGASFEDLEADAATRPPAAVLCLPYFLGEKSPLHDPSLRGAYVGLDLAHTRGDLYRATLEAVAFAFRHHVEVFAEMGMELTRGMVANGGSRSTLWKQITADVLGTDLTPVANHPGASLGAAAVAAKGLGLLDSWGQVRGFVEFGETFHPDPVRAAVYQDAYALWRQCGEAIRPLSHALAKGLRAGVPTTLGKAESTNLGNAAQ